MTVVLNPPKLTIFVSDVEHVGSVMDVIFFYRHHPVHAQDITSQHRTWYFRFSHPSYG
jgi:hypothetical protein